VFFEAPPSLSDLPFDVRETPRRIRVLLQPPLSHLDLGLQLSCSYAQSLEPSVDLFSVRSADLALSVLGPL
jgi:hypothetical protein